MNLQHCFFFCIIISEFGCLKGRLCIIRCLCIFYFQCTILIICNSNESCHSICSIFNRFFYKYSCILHFSSFNCIRISHLFTIYNGYCIFRNHFSNQISMFTFCVNMIFIFDILNCIKSSNTSRIISRLSLQYSPCLLINQLEIKIRILYTFWEMPRHYLLGIKLSLTFCFISINECNCIFIKIRRCYCRC